MSLINEVKFLSLAEAGKTAKEIAAHFGCSTKHVYEFARKRGIKLYSFHPGRPGGWGRFSYEKGSKEYHKWYYENVLKQKRKEQKK